MTTTDDLIRLLESKLAAENELNMRLHSKSDGSVDALTHYSDGRRDAFITILEHARHLSQIAEGEAANV